MRHPGREDGVATVAALALFSALVLAALVAVAIGQQASAREQLATAGDIAALAAAQAGGEPCAAAESMALANAVTLADCRTEGADVVVTLTRPPAPLTARLLAWLGHDARDLMVVARAGPPP